MTAQERIKNIDMSNAPAKYLKLLERLGYDVENSPRSTDSEVKKILRERQKDKQFQDTEIVNFSKKYKINYNMITQLDLSELEKDPVMAKKQVTKDKVWGEFEPLAYKELGYSSGAVYLLNEIYKAISKAPADSKDARELYVKYINAFKKALSENVYGIGELRDLVAKVKDDVFGNFTSSRKFKAVMGNRLLSFHYTTDSVREKLSLAKQYNGISKKEAQEQTEYYKKLNEKIVIYKNLLIFYKENQDQYASLLEDFHANKYGSHDEIQNATKVLIDAIVKDFANSGRVDKDKFYAIYNDEATWLKSNIWRIMYYVFNNPAQLEYKIQQYDTKNPEVKPVPQDWSWLEVDTKTKKTNTKKKSHPINKKPPLNHIVRKGGYKIPEVSEQSIKKHYGYSNISFGNYVNNAESMENVRYFLGAMSDLGQILNMDVKELNEIGGLGLGIGLMGVGGHLATYFSQLKYINLAKGKGDGSVAHEWMHYIDNILIDGKEQKGTPEFASEFPGKLPEEIKTNFMDVMKAIYYGTGNEDNIVYLEIKAQKTRRYKVYADDIKTAISEAQKKYRYYKHFENKNKKNFREYFGWLAHHFGKDSISVPVISKKSRYYVNSAQIGSEYWVRPLELLARAFETYIEYKLQQANMANNYLVTLNKYQDIEDSERPYPSGSELKALAPKFDNLFQTIKEHYSISDFSPAINEKVDINRKV